jgi:hypothetical protein
LKKILIISFSAIRSDPRVMRQIRQLSSSYDVAVAGFGAKPEADIRFVEVVKPRASLLRKSIWALKLLLGAFEGYYWSQYHVQAAAHLLRDVAPDVIIANDLPALPLALKLAGGKPVIYDAHEYTPGEYEDQFLWRLLFGRYSHAFCRKYLPRVASMLTVSQGIADEYTKHYGVRPLVVHNAPVNQYLSPSSVQDGAIRMVHHGVASSVRHLEVMIEMMAFLDRRFTLDLMLIEVEPGYMKFLREKARHDTRIRFIEPVAMPQICLRINAYDVGLFLLPPRNFNYRHALPNKFFEFVHACLVVAIGPSPEMAALTRKHGCGVVAESFAPQALAGALSGLDADKVRTLKEASHRAAQVLCFEQDGLIIEAEVRRLA